MLSYMVTTKEKNQMEKLSSVNLFKNKSIKIFFTVSFFRCAILQIKIDIWGFVCLVGVFKYNIANFKNITQDF